MNKKFTQLFISLALVANGLLSANQTAITTPILPSDGNVPFQISIDTADFSLPNGIHSCATAAYKGYWVLLAGRTNGLHGFDNNDNNFPPQQQNTVVYVINTITKTVTTKSLADPSSGLTQDQIDSLSVTSPQSCLEGNTLYVTGGYGVETQSGNFSTKPLLTAINIPGLIHWVLTPSPGETAAQYIRQTSHEIVRVTGGYMTRVGSPHNYYLLVFGQNFEGFYNANSNGNYSQQVRCFRIFDNGKDLMIFPKPLEPQNPNYRRRDLNVVPIIRRTFNDFKPFLVALSGVFTPTDDGIWTVPVTIGEDGSAFMPDPTLSGTFKQGMNNYVCPTVGLFSKSTNNMFTVLLGGISFGFFDDGDFETDSEIPFINQVTTIKIDQNGVYSQYLMDNEYPVILSTGSNPGNPLLFGAGAAFFPNPALPTFNNGVIRLDEIGTPPVLLGYIVGGIQSTLPNTNTQADSAASPYIFAVTLTAPQ